MTEGIRQTMQQLTGDALDTCPWRAFTDPLVKRVLEVLWAAKDGAGALAMVLPEPSHRLMQGLGHYLTVDNRVACKLLDLELEGLKGYVG